MGNIGRKSTHSGKLFKKGYCKIHPFQKMVIVIKEQAIRFWHLLLSILRLVDNNIRRLFSLPSSYHKIPPVPLVVPLYSRDRARIKSSLLYKPHFELDKKLSHF